MNKGGPDHWRVEDYLPHARSLLNDRNYFSTKQLAEALQITGQLAGAILKRLGGKKYSRKGGGKSGIVYEAPEEGWGET